MDYNTNGIKEYEEAQAARVAGRYREARRLFFASAKLGNANADYEIGEAYRIHGLCLFYNGRKSYDHFKRAAERGHAIAIARGYGANIAEEDAQQALKLDPRADIYWWSGRRMRPDDWDIIRLAGALLDAQFTEDMSTCSAMEALWNLSNQPFKSLGSVFDPALLRPKLAALGHVPSQRGMNTVHWVAQAALQHDASAMDMVLDKQVHQYPARVVAHAYIYSVLRESYKYDWTKTTNALSRPEVVFHVGRIRVRELAEDALYNIHNEENKAIANEALKHLDDAYLQRCDTAMLLVGLIVKRRCAMMHGIDKNVIINIARGLLYLPVITND